MIAVHLFHSEVTPGSGVCVSIRSLLLNEEEFLERKIISGLIEHILLVRSGFKDSLPLIFQRCPQIIFQAPFINFFLFIQEVYENKL